MPRAVNAGLESWTLVSIRSLVETTGTPTFRMLLWQAVGFDACPPAGGLTP